MKRFLIHVSTYWCGMDNTFRAVAESLEMAMKKIEGRLWDDVLEDEPTNVSIKNINHVDFIQEVPI